MTNVELAYVHRLLTEAFFMQVFLKQLFLGWTNFLINKKGKIPQAIEKVEKCLSYLSFQIDPSTINVNEKIVGFLEQEVKLYETRKRTSTGITRESELSRSLLFKVLQFGTIL